jgi:hypothetical protein
MATFQQTRAEDSPAPAPPEAAPTPERDASKLKSGLKGKGYDEQSAMLAPQAEPLHSPEVSHARATQAGPDVEHQVTKPYPPDVVAVLARWPEGVAMSFFVDYADGVKGKAEFAGRAKEQAASLGAVALVGGKLVMGKAHGIQDQATIIEKTNAVTAYLSRFLSPQDVALERHKLAQLHIYGHGSGRGISTGGERGPKGEGDMLSKNIEDFVAAIGGSLRSNVNVALMACFTGKDVNKKGTKTPQANGEGSFADTFRDELVAQGHEDANVGGHTTKGHTSGNPLARYFTGDAEADTVFDTFFPKAFREAEAAKLGMPEDKFRSKLRSWYIHYTVIWRVGKLGEGKNTRRLEKGAQKVDLGYLMLVDPAKAKDIFRSAWAATGGKFSDYSYVPTVDWSTVGVSGGDGAAGVRE